MKKRGQKFARMKARVENSRSLVEATCACGKSFEGRPEQALKLREMHGKLCQPLKGETIRLEVREAGMPERQWQGRSKIAEQALDALQRKINQ